MHVLLVEPSFPQNQQRFVHALASVGARVTGIGEAPYEYLPESIREALYGYEQVPSVVHEASMLETVRRVQAREWVDRLESTVEAHIMPVAKVREACSIPGTSVQTSYLCRDKPAMKEALSAAGVPCAQSAGISTPADARDFAKKVGYPLIFKPRSGAGAADTDRIDDDEQLEAAIIRHGIADGQSVAVEEFIEGHEGFFDTISIGGHIAVDFISHYYPVVLDAMRARWISPYFITTNRLDLDSYGPIKAMGKKVIETLGIETSATHQEWFYGPKGLKFSEVGCRPPGVGVWDIYCAANDFDIYREWANAIVHGELGQQPSRRYSAGMIALRPDRDGRILGYEGWDEVQERYGEWIIDHHFPPPGTGTQPVEAGYMANAWLRMRHPDYDTLRGMLDTVGRVVQVRASA